MGAQARCRDAARSAVPGRLLGGAGGRPAGAARRGSDPGRTARREPARNHRHAQRCVRAAADLDHLRPGQPVPRGAGGAADVPARSLDPVEAVSAGRGEQHRGRAQRPGAALRRGDAEAHHRAARDLASGAIPVDLAQLQPRPGRSARRRRRGGEDDRDPDRDAQQHRRRLCRRCRRICQGARRPAMAAARRRDHDLHRAGRAL